MKKTKLMAALTALSMTTGIFSAMVVLPTTAAAAGGFERVLFEETEIPYDSEGWFMRFRPSGADTVDGQKKKDPRLGIVREIVAGTGVGSTAGMKITIPKNVKDATTINSSGVESSSAYVAYYVTMSPNKLDLTDSEESGKKYVTFDIKVPEVYSHFVIAYSAKNDTDAYAYVNASDYLDSDLAGQYQRVTIPLEVFDNLDRYYYKEGTVRAAGGRNEFRGIGFGILKNDSIPEDSTEGFEFYVDNFKIIGVGAPTELKTVDTVDGIKLQWVAPTGTSADSTVSEYKIYRNDGEVFEVAAEDITDTETNIVEFADEDAKLTYTYYVEGYTACGAYNVSKNSVTGTPAPIVVENEITLHAGETVIPTTEDSDNDTVLHSTGTLPSGVITAKAVVRNEKKNPINLTLVEVLSNGGKVEAVNTTKYTAPAKMEEPYTMTTTVDATGAAAGSKISTYLIYEMNDDRTADNTITVEVTDPVAQTVEITGTAPHGQAGKSIDLVIYNPKKSLSDVADNNEASATAAIQYIGRGVTEANGKYTFNLTINAAGIEGIDVESNTYTVCVFGEEIEGARVKDDFLYYGNEVKEGIVEDVNDADSLAEFKENLDPEQFFTVLLGNDFPLVKDIDDKDEIVEILIDLKNDLDDEADLTELTKLTKEAIVLAALNLNVAEIFGEEGEDGEMYISPLYVQTMGIADTTAYDTYKNDLSVDGVEALNEAISGEDIDDMEELYDLFMEQAVLKALAYPKSLGYSHVADVIEKNSEYLEDMGFDVEGYSDLSSTTKVDKAVYEGAKEGISSINDLKELFNDNIGGKSSSNSSSSNNSSPKPPKTTTPIVGSTTNTLPLVNTNGKDDVKPAFADLTAVPWAVESINALVEKGIVAGMTETQFAPQNDITREQFAKMLVLALGLDMNAAADISFTDVSADSWSRSYIAVAYQYGIVTGRSAEVFGAADKITREEIAVMVARGIRAIGANVPTTQKPEFADSADISDYAKEDVNAIKDMGIMSGRENNMFAPKAYITRAEAAKTLHNFLLVR